MATLIRKVASIGARGQPPRRVRQIALTNLIALCASTATSTYQLFYVLHDFRYYLPVFLANVVFIGAYLSALPMNRAGRFDLARNVVLGTVYVHLFAVTFLIGTGAGVHLFYFTLGACLSLLFTTSREIVSLMLMAVAATLYVVCHHAFPPGSTPIEIPETVLRLMYAWSAAGAVFLAGAFSIFFRVEIDGAERALVHTNQELERLSTVDPLTGVANRRTLDRCLASEWGRLSRHGKPLAVILCDVDCFKAFNDLYGHVAGDRCLQQIASVLAGSVRRGSDLVARYGGEEYAIVLPLTNAEGALGLANAARQHVLDLRIPHARSEAGPVVSISAGIACAYPGELTGPEDLLHRADVALYASKRDGRNRATQSDGGATNAAAVAGKQLERQEGERASGIA